MVRPRLRTLAQAAPPAGHRVAPAIEVIPPEITARWAGPRATVCRAPEDRGIRTAYKAYKTMAVRTKRVRARHSSWWSTATPIGWRHSFAGHKMRYGRVNSTSDTYRRRTR
jgi:hypothetical protein